ncbi:unnamed protein product [Rotaria sordida]|uniref:Uncharacterized protein n=1 Tax=Rotaria sordida TaxID=392033 RepID=A0A813SNV2_9BILA|nr:unnamed protein product [Rotaria sordida]CAF0799012.1 unnamed protein product [Rotaria sordida]CAF3556708.1 unnamed protein product [Rotaria sordida]CAF3771375.1 unnamed protein product [Rotaria sordida]
MIFIKAIAGVLITIIIICDGQFLTPDQLREQQDLGYGARTHYDLSGGRLTDMFNRINPDYLLRGFFPFWSVVLIAFALVFLTIAVIGLIGYLLGCRRPTAEEIYVKEFQRIPPDDELLLGNDGSTNANGIQISTNEYFNNNQDFPYKSSPLAERTRIGHSGEDMV